MEDSGAYLKYLKDLPMDKRINSLGTFLGRAKQAAHTNGKECGFQSKANLEPGPALTLKDLGQDASLLQPSISTSVKWV